MHLHTLTLQAMGPFPRMHTIDFGALGRSGLFLLEGPTGAGKSSIIDAIVFALYGDLAGAEASKQRLHSHHAKADVEPFVDLTFETQAGIFRVRRSPAHERPKRSGNGTTTQNEKATLSKLASIDAPDAAEPLSNRNAEIGAEIKRIIGLDRKQFLQTVVLPQGEFARFLRSTGEDRKDLLRTIFRTDIYEDMIGELKTLRAAALQTIAKSKTAVGRTLASFTTACGHNLGEGFDEDDFDAMQVVCTKVAAQVDAEATAAADEDITAQSALKDAVERRVEEQRVAGLLRTRTALCARKKQVDNQSTEITGLRRQIDSARRAHGVALAIEGLHKARTAAAHAQVGLETAHHHFGDDCAMLSSDDLAKLRDSIVAECNTLKSLLDIESGLTTRRAALQHASTRVTTLHQHIEALETEVAVAPKTIDAIECQREKLLGAIQHTEEAQRAVESAHKVLAAATEALALEQQLVDLCSQRDRRISSARTATEEVALLRQRRLDQYAGVLSSKLIAGQPCAVCGSEAHPAPATLEHDHPSDSDIEAADQSCKHAETAAQNAAEVVQAHESRLALQRERADGHDLLAANDVLKAAEGSLTEAKSATQQLQTVTTELQAAKNRLATDHRNLQKSTIELTTLRVDVDTQTADLKADDEHIAALLAGRADSLAALSDDLTDRLARADKVIGARSELAAAQDALASRHGDVDQALHDNNFESIQGATDAVLSAAQIESITQSLTAYDAESSIVNDALAKPEIAVLTGAESTDVEAALVAEADLTQRARQTGRQASVLGARSASTQECLKGLDRALTALGEAHTGSATAIKLAGIAEGTHAANLKKVSLGTYVLMRRFDDVVAAANVRYGPMSAGRYQLTRIDEKEGKGGGHRTGLALAVRDSETGKQREPRTLSGGETFNASLCLALGLADVVTGEAGGIELGTLFVDEGFGTLDTDALDRVMVELGKLAKNGREVGIVSHVEDLKQRVADRIEVRPITEGGSTLIVKCAEVVS